MKAITIIQPWATLIAIGEKRFETRGWATRYRGPIAIHAGKKVEKEVCEAEPYRSVLAAHGYTPETLPTGAIVAIADLSNCYPVSISNSYYAALFGYVGYIEGNELEFGWYKEGRYAWEISNVSRIESVPTKGQQGLWNWEPQGDGGIRNEP